MEIDPIVSSTAQGMTAMIEYGVLGAVACVAIGFSIMVMWVLIKQAKACFEGTKEVVKNNTDALHGVQIALTRIETKLDVR